MLHTVPHWTLTITCELLSSPVTSSYLLVFPKLSRGLCTGFIIMRKKSRPDTCMTSSVSCWTFSSIPPEGPTSRMPPGDRTTLSLAQPSAEPHHGPHPARTARRAWVEWMKTIQVPFGNRFHGLRTSGRVWMWHVLNVLFYSIVNVKSLQPKHKVIHCCSGKARIAPASV